MFDRLLILLDGSRLAESVLPAARGLARQFGEAGTLLHVVERRPPSAVHGDRHLATIAEAGGYLQGLAAQVFSGLPVRTHVHGPEDIDVAASIARHADEMEVELIVLCTHGGGGARELLFGSVAQQVLGRGSVPVLLMRSEGAGSVATRITARSRRPMLLVRAPGIRETP